MPCWLRLSWQGRVITWQMMGLCLPGCDCTCLGFVHAVVFVCSTQGRVSSLSQNFKNAHIQNSSSKISACPDLATNLLQILTPTTSNSLLCQKRRLILQLSPRTWSVGKNTLFLPPKKSKLKKNYIKILPVQKGDFQETTCPKDRQGGSWLSPWLYLPMQWWLYLYLKVVSS